MSYLSEDNLPAVFPETMVIDSDTYTKTSTESLADSSGTLQFQWCQYEGPPGKYVARFCRPDNTATPVLYYYDEFDQTSGSGMSPEQCQLAALSKVASIWNAI